MARPGMRWNGKLHRPVRFGEGMKPGTVESEQRSRIYQIERRQIDRIFAERERQKRGPAKWYLKSWPFVLVKALGRLVVRS